MAPKNPSSTSKAKADDAGAAPDDSGAALAAMTEERDSWRQKAEAFHVELLEARELLEAQAKVLDGLEVGIPKLEAVGATAAGLQAIEAEVAKAVAFVKRLRSMLPAEERPLTREDTGPYRVLEDKQINYGGGLTVITRGTRVDVRSYGVVGIMRLREQGVKMELLEEEG